MPCTIETTKSYLLGIESNITDLNSIGAGIDPANIDRQNHRSGVGVFIQHRAQKFLDGGARQT